MTIANLSGETLLTIKQAAENFGGISIPVRTVEKYVYEGVRGLKLETVFINGRYTSKEAIQRFIERRQNPEQTAAPKKKKNTRVEEWTQERVDATLRKHGLKE